MSPDSLSALVNLQNVEFSEEDEGARLNQDKVKRLRQMIPSDILDIYDILKMRYRNRSIVRIELGACSGCHIMLPASRMIQVDSNVSLCEHCGRILYSGERVGIKLSA